MTKRKILLLSLIALFTIVYVVQLTQTGKSTVQDITIEEDITGIRIGKTGIETLTYLKQETPATEGTEASDMWTIEGSFQVETFPMSRMEEQIKNIRVLGKVSTKENAERYDLQEGKALIIEALNGQEVLRTITIGKASTTTSQTYAIIDNANDVVLVSGDLNDIFNKTRDELAVVNEEEGIDSL